MEYSTLSSSIQCKTSFVFAVETWYNIDTVLRAGKFGSEPRRPFVRPAVTPVCFARRQMWIVQRNYIDHCATRQRGAPLGHCVCVSLAITCAGWLDGVRRQSPVEWTVIGVNKRVLLLGRPTYLSSEPTSDRGVSSSSRACRGARRVRVCRYSTIYSSF